MTTYTYRCGWCGSFDVEKSAEEAGRVEFCPRHRLSLVQRIYNQQRKSIIRPRGWSLRPGERDPTVPGLSYSNFAHELARGELTEDATPVYTPESRARREAELAAEDERPPAMDAIDRDIPERAHQELHEWARAAYSRLEEERRYA